MGVNTVRFKFFKKDELKYLSHLDVLALMERALMRTGMALLYSGGFHPKPKLSFSNPIPLGVQSIAEYCDIELLEEISALDFTGILNRKLPDNLKVINALSFEKTPENKIPSLMSAIDIVLYEYELIFRKLSPGAPDIKEFPENISLERESLEREQLIKESLSSESLISSFLKDFRKMFGPAGKNEECEADLIKIRNSIRDYEIIVAQTAPVASVANEPSAAPATQLADVSQTQSAAENEAACNVKTTTVAGITFAAQTATPADQTAPGPMENIFFLKIYGYAKILKNSSNTIFKFNAFNEYFEKFLETKDIEVRQIQKTGTYILKNNVLTDPIGIISF